MNNSSRLLLRRANALWHSLVKGSITRIDRRLWHRNLGRSLGATMSSWNDRRCFSSNTTATPKVDEPEIVLYEKSPGHVTLIRSGFGFSCFNTLYWIWYAVDFVPTVNASPMESLHVDPMIPTAGIVFAVIVQTIFTGYPLRLISKLGWRPASRQLALYTHVLPGITPALSTPTLKDVGEVRLDPASVEAQRIATLGGLQSFTGMLTIGKTGQWPPYLIDVKKGDQANEPEILLELLLEPERVQQEEARGSSAVPVPTSSRKQQHTFSKRGGRGRRRR